MEAALHQVWCAQHADARIDLIPHEDGGNHFVQCGAHFFAHSDGGRDGATARMAVAGPMALIVFEAMCVRCIDEGRVLRAHCAFARDHAARTGHVVRIDHRTHLTRPGQP
ncbi:hypothetical protein D3C87_1601800 [compost metagenome]